MSVSGSAEATFLAQFRPTSNWVAGKPSWEQPMWDQHAAFINALLRDGLLYMGGPAADFSAIFLVLQNGDRDALRARLDQDPWITGDMIRLESFVQWTPLVDPRR